MAAFSDFSENKIIDWMFRGQAIGINGATAAAGTGPGTLFVALHTSASTDAAAGTEVSGNAYARVAVTSSLANWAGTQGAGTTVVSTGTSGTTSNNATIAYPTPSASWGTLVGMSVYDAATGGNMLIYSALASSKFINSGDTVSFAPGVLTFQLDN